MNSNVCVLLASTVYNSIGSGQRCGNVGKARGVAFSNGTFNTVRAVISNQRWSRGHKARGQGQGQGHKKNPRPRPRPRTAFPRTDTLEAKDRNARGQGQGPRTQSASALQKKKKKGLHKNFSGDLQKKKKGLHKNFSSDLHEKTFSKKFFNRSTKF